MLFFLGPSRGIISLLGEKGWNGLRSGEGDVTWFANIPKAIGQRRQEGCVCVSFIFIVLFHVST